MRIHHLAAAATLALASSAFAAPFEISADGQEVTDTATGLIWRRCAEGMQWTGSGCEGDILATTFDKAKVLAQTEASASKKGWRVPTLQELVKLVDKGQPSAPMIDPKAFPNTPGMQFWTSTVNTRPGQEHRAYFVFFGTGLTYEEIRQMPFNVRLVRSK